MGLMTWLTKNEKDGSASEGARIARDVFENVLAEQFTMGAFGLLADDLGAVNAAKEDLRPVVTVAFQGIGPRLKAAPTPEAREAILAESEGSFARMVLARSCRDEYSKRIRGCAAHLLMREMASRI